ncbi:MAG: PadR family transcriptional regulator [Staphylothermus sp.]|nr:PadR family transcriptional regulator [Staphylothermus sp.]
MGDKEPKALVRLRRKLTIENLWIYIMKILIVHKEIRAYDARKLLRTMFGINAPSITIYGVIYRMTREGLLEKVTRNNETLYRPTSKGLEAYHEGIKLLENILQKLKN